MPDAPWENLPRRETMQKLTTATVFAELQGKEIALIGLGVSHRPVAKLLAQKGMKVKYILSFGRFTFVMLLSAMPFL